MWQTAILAEIYSIKAVLLYISRYVQCLNNDEYHQCMYNQSIHYSKLVTAIVRYRVSQSRHSCHYRLISNGVTNAFHCKSIENPRAASSLRNKFRDKHFGFWQFRCVFRVKTNRLIGIEKQLKGNKKREKEKKRSVKQLIMQPFNSSCT